MKAIQRAVLLMAIEHVRRRLHCPTVAQFLLTLGRNAVSRGEQMLNLAVQPYGRLTGGLSRCADKGHRSFQFRERQIGF
jgi:hypothetical protein